MSFSYSKKEKLKSKKLIDTLFIEGTSIKAFPLRMVFVESALPSSDITMQTGVSVSKRNFKLAVTRNRIKRLMRESYRLHKHLFETKGTTFAAMLIYTGREEVTQETMHRAMLKLIKRFNERDTTSRSQAKITKQP